MKGKAIIPLVLGLCVGLVAVKFLVDKIQNARGSQGDKQTMTIVRATQDIDAFKALTAEMIEVITVPDSDLVPPRDRVTSVEDVIGRVTAKAIPQFAPVLKSMLAEEGTRAGMVGQIPPGYRAVSVKIDEVTGVAYQINPGDWVDVIVVMDIDTGGGSFRRETIAEVILQHVQVLAMGQGIRPEKGSTIKPAKSATLLVEQADAPKLHLAATRGKVTLSMRGEDDTINESVQIATGSDVFQGIKKANPTPTNGLDAATVATLLAMANASQGDPSQLDADAEMAPFKVTVYRGFTTPDGITPTASTAQFDWQQIQHVTFANKNSRKILGVSEGPISSSQAAMASRKSPDNPNAMRELMKSKLQQRGGK